RLSRFPDEVAIRRFAHTEARHAGSDQGHLPHVVRSSWAAVRPPAPHLTPALAAPRGPSEARCPVPRPGRQGGPRLGTGRRRVLRSLAHDAPVEGRGDFSPGGGGGRLPFRAVGHFVRRPTGADSGRGRLSPNALPPLRDGRHRDSTGAPPPRGSGRGLSREEPLAGGPGPVGCWLVPVGCGARLLVRPRGPVQRRFLPPAAAFDEGPGRPHRKPGRGRTSHHQSGGTRRGAYPVAVGAGGGRARRGRAGSAVASRVSVLVLPPLDLRRVALLPSRDPGPLRERAWAAARVGNLRRSGGGHASDGCPAHARAGVGTLGGLESRQAPPPA